MEFNYEFAAKLIIAILLLFVISDQLQSPADPRDSAPHTPAAEHGGVDLHLAALEEASLLLKLAERALPYANAPLVQASAMLGPANAELPLGSAAMDDQTCHTAVHTGYSGDRAVVWGLGKPGFHLNTSAECCNACKAHAATCSQKGAHAKSWWPTRPEMKCGGNPPCNMWTHCPEERCFAFDIHVHTFGECWLKHQAANHTHAKDPHEGNKVYPPKMRFAPRKIWPHAVREDVWSGPMPEYIPWTSGVLAPANAVVNSAPPDDQWRRRWCSKYGPCE